MGRSAGAPPVLGRWGGMKPDVTARHIAGEPQTSGLVSQISLKDATGCDIASLDVFGGEISEDEEQADPLNGGEDAGDGLVADDGASAADGAKPKGKGKGKRGGRGRPPAAGAAAEGKAKAKRQGSVAGKSQG